MPGVPSPMLKWLLEFIVIAESKLVELRDRRSRLQRSLSTS